MQNRKIDIQKAQELLNVSFDTLKKIPTLALRKRYICYKFIKTEFDLLASSVNDPNIKNQITSILNRASDAKETLLNSSIINENITDYSAHSIGLWEFETHTPYVTAATEFSSDDLNHSVIQTEKKSSGVEPGFKGFQIQDVLEYIAQQYPDQKERHQFILKHKANIHVLYENIKDKLQTAYLIKLNHEVSQDGTITPKPEDVSRSKRVKNISKYIGPSIPIAMVQWFKTAHVATINSSAVLEVLANDLARIFMQVQDQKIYPGKTSDGIFQVLLKGKWVAGSKELGPLFGSTNHQSYCAKPVILKKKKDIDYLSDDSIEHFGEYLPALLVFGDRDAIGSSGQNKLVQDNQLVAIDFGHAFQKKLVPDILPNFHLNNSQCKNFSVFYDSRRSDIMKGFIRLARECGRKIPNNVLISYGKDFESEINTQTPRIHEFIFADYLKKFEALRSQSLGDDKVSETNRKSYDEIIASITQAKKDFTENCELLLSKFQSYLDAEKSLVDLTENIEKFVAGKENTSLRSPDNKVLLHHLRITNDQSISWKINSKHSDNHTLIATFDTEQAAEIALSKLKIISPDLTLSRQKRDITLNFKKNTLASLLGKLDEEKLKKSFFAEDFNLYHHYVSENKFASLLSSFNEFGINIKLSESHLLNHYHLNITADTQSRSIIIDILKKYGHSFEIKENQIELDFQKNELINVDKIFIAIYHTIKQTIEKNETPPQKKIEAEKKQQETSTTITLLITEFVNIKHQIQTYCHKQKTSPPEFILQTYQDKFYFKLDSSECDDTFGIVIKETIQDFILKHPILDLKELPILNDKLKQLLNTYQEKQVAEKKIQESLQTVLRLLTKTPQASWLGGLSWSGFSQIALPTNQLKPFIKTSLTYAEIEKLENILSTQQWAPDFKEKVREALQLCRQLSPTADIENNALLSEFTALNI